MKKVLIFAAFLISTVGFAQTGKDEVDFVQSIYGKAKRDIVLGFVALEGEKRDAFLAVYDEYEVKRKELGLKRVALLEEYAANYGSMNDPATDYMIKEMTKLGVKTDKLIGTYYTKVKKAAGIKAAAQFVQIEIYLLSSVRVAILDNIPFIGELD